MHAIVTASIALLLGSESLPAADAVARVRIPFVVDLVTVRASVTEQGDYETVRVVNAIDASGYSIATSGQVPADDGSGLMDTRFVRVVAAADQLAARKMRAYFHSSDPQTFPGTVPGFSAALLNDLRGTGKASFTYVDVTPSFGMTTARDLTGTLQRIDGPASLPMLVNGRSVLLPIIHAKGQLSDGSDTEDFDFQVLDDPANPLVLRWSGAGNSSNVIRIEYPEPNSIERSLAANDTVEIYGIYFSFARADIRPQSERVLKEIAAVFKAHPDWKIRIDGHTDNVGNDTANLDLSKRRAAAVKTALVTRFGIDAGRIATGGYGESAPKEKNDTPEGRARNRRVELRRQ